MDPESKKLLEDTHRLVEENNNLLHRVRNIQRWSTYWMTLKIIVIVGIALGSFYFLEPILNKIVDFYNSISGTEQNPDSSSSFQDFWKKLGN